MISCQSSFDEVEYETINLPMNGTVWSIEKLNDSWFISGGNTGSNGFILRSDSNFSDFDVISDTLDWPVHDQIYQTNRYYFAADHIEVYSAPDELSKVWIYYPPERYWVNDLNKKTNWKIEQTPEKDLYIACGGGFNKGVIFHSPPDSPHWIPVEFDHEMRDVAYQSSGIVWGCGYGLLVKSTDGSTWIDQGFYNRFFTSIDFWDDKNGVLATFDGIIYKTSDGGQNWEEVDRIKGFGGGLSINTMRYCSEKVVVAIGNGGYFNISTNGGLNWSKKQGFDSNNLYDFEYHQGTVYMVGEASVVYHVNL